jgi:hypothetical protein
MYCILRRIEAAIVTAGEITLTGVTLILIVEIGRLMFEQIARKNPAKSS